MRRSLALPALTVVLALGGVSCRSGGSDDLATVRAASAKTVAATSAKVAITVVTDIDGSRLTLTGEGSYDLARQQGLLSLGLGSLLAGTILDARIVGDTAYVATPGIVAGIVGTPFLKVDVAALVTQNAKFGPLTSTANPAASVDALRGAEYATKGGTETVRGEATTRYRGRLDLSEAREQVADAARTALGRLSALLGGDLVAYDVWIDEAGRVRRMTLMSVSSATDVTEVSPSLDGTNGSTMVTTELYEYGAAVEVDVPPADQVGDGNALLSSFVGG